MDLQNFYKLLFDNDEFSCFGDLYSNAISPVSDFKPSEFFSINPLHPDKDYDAKASYKYSENAPRRADLNVTKFRNFLFEMDTVDLEDQMKIIEGCGIPFTSIVYSGGKSYHCILSLEVPLEFPVHSEMGISLYKMEWSRWAEKINQYCESLFPGKYKTAVDKAMKNPSRLSRAPGFTRANGKEQKLIYLGNRISEDNYFNLLKTCPKINIQYKELVIDSDMIDFSINSVSDFWHYSPPGLRNKLRYSHRWVDSAGMYPLLFQYTLWAIDKTNVKQDIFLKVLEESVFKEFDRVNYPRYKYLLGVNSAYKYKQQRG